MLKLQLAQKSVGMLMTPASVRDAPIPHIPRKRPPATRIIKLSLRLLVRKRDTLPTLAIVEIVILIHLLMHLDTPRLRIMQSLLHVQLPVSPRESTALFVAPCL